jgi:hypothetical protein
MQGTWNEERRELLDSISEELRRPGSDSDGREACRLLLQHLERTSHVTF